MKSIVVTGGAGFIGSSVVRLLIAETDYTVINLDKLTYAGNLETLSDIDDKSRHIFVRKDICDGAGVGEVLQRYEPEKILHLAAESHVDRSIDGPSEFVNTNIVGTYTLLENARDYWNRLRGRKRSSFRFHHVSTDEVYGSLGETGYFTEATAYRPNSPYAASKASSDHLVRAWFKTYGLPTIISNCSNNYGPYQYPEKLIPLIINKALAGKPLPIYGKGDNVRDWLYVEDHAKALLTIAETGKVGEVYNVGGGNELKNIETVTKICDLLDQVVPREDGNSYKQLMEFVEDRPGHDRRYAIDASKIKRELGWEPSESFDSGLRKTIDWYLKNPDWCKSVSKTYGGERLGAGT